MTKSFALCVLLALSSCKTKGPEKPAPAPSQPQPPAQPQVAETKPVVVSCDTSVTGAIQRSMNDEMKNADDLPPDKREQAEAMLKEVIPKITAALIHSCEADGWSEEVRGCFDKAAHEDEYDACERRLTPEQKRRALQAAADAMGMSLPDNSAPPDAP